MTKHEAQQTSDIFGYPFSRRGLVGDVEQALAFCGHWDGKARYVACGNPHSLVTAKSDAEFQAALLAADLLLPDGAGILLASRMFHGGIPERVAGMEFFLGLSARGNVRGDVSYYFLGSSVLVLERIKQRLAVEFPRISVVGTNSPPFVDEFTERDLSEMIGAINAARPTVLWVGMTAPKQEKWIYRHRHRLEVPLVGAIGAVFDFYAGTRTRAPEWVRDLGLEWLPRLLREPRRLWRRNFVSTPIFLWDVIRKARRS